MEKELDIFVDEEPKQEVVEINKPVIASEETFVRVLELEEKIKEHKAELEVLEATYNEIKKGLMEGMKQNSLKTFETDKVKITYTPVSYRATLDTKRIQSEEPEIYAKYVRETQSSERLTITIKKEEN